MTAPTTQPRWNDPANPLSLGYDAASPAYAAAFGEAVRLDVLPEFEEQLARVTADWLAWCEEYRRRGAGGVSLAGDCMEPWSAPHPDRLLARAIERKAGRVAYAASPEGRARAYVHAIETAADNACDWTLLDACDEARSALDRNDGSAPRRLAVLAEITKGSPTYHVLASAAVGVLEAA